MYYQPRARKAKPYPVADDFFKPVHLSSQRLAGLRAQAARMLHDALVECRECQDSCGTYLFNRPPWQLHTQHEGLSEFKRRSDKLPTTSLSRVFGSVSGDYRDFIRFYQSPTRDKYYSVQKKLFHDTIDAAVLSNVPQADSDFYEGVKWATYEPFQLRFRMDVCHFESTGTGVDAQGKHYAFRVIVPAAFPEVPDLLKSKRTLRIHAASVMIARPSDRGTNRSELFMAMTNDFKSNRVPRSMYQRHLMSLHSMGVYLESLRTCHVNLNRIGQQRKDCEVCARPFSMLRSKHNCTGCDATVCRKCVVKGSDTKVLVIRRGDAKTAMKLCKPCFQRTQQELQHAQTMPMDNQGKMFASPTESSSSCFSSSYGSDRLRSQSEHLVSPPEYRVEANPTTTRRMASTRPRERSAASMAMHTDSTGEIHDRVIYEEEAEMLSGRSVELTLDTSTMARVRDAVCKPVDVTSHALQSIHSSLAQQEMLLRQLQLAARTHAHSDEYSL